MKRNLTLLVITIVILMISSCGSTEISVPEAPEPSLTLIRFTNPSYVNNIIVTDYDNFKGFVIMRGNECDEHYLKNTSGKEWIYDFPSLDSRTPYIELNDGWYLVDWSWSSYPYNGQVLLTDITWEKYKGEFGFDKSTAHISGNIYERIGIKVSDLVIYSFPDGNYPLFKFHGVHDRTGEEYVEELNEYLYFSSFFGGRGCVMSPSLSYIRKDGYCLCNKVEELDDLWELFRQQLNTAIGNGEILSIPSATDEQLRNLLGDRY